LSVTLLVMIRARTAPVPAFAAAGLASAIISGGWGMAAFVSGILALGRQGRPLVGLLFSPFVGMALALLCAALALLPALTWAFSAKLLAPRLACMLRGWPLGLAVGAACTAPATLVTLWISHGHLIEPEIDLSGLMLSASIAGGIAAGMILAWLIRYDARAAYDAAA
jgi:hypothetical protein